MSERASQSTDDGACTPTWRCLDCGTEFYDIYAPERGDLGGPCPPECPRCGEEERLEWIGLDERT